MAEQSSVHTSNGTLFIQGQNEGNSDACFYNRDEPHGIYAKRWYTSTYLSYMRYLVLSHSEEQKIECQLQALKSTEWDKLLFTSHGTSAFQDMKSIKTR